MILGDFGVFDAETEFVNHQNYQSFIEFPESAGNDEIYGGDGDDFILGQEVRLMSVQSHKFSIFQSKASFTVAWNPFYSLGIR